jgi:hypothetical protein
MVGIPKAASRILAYALIGNWVLFLALSLALTGQAGPNLVLFSPCWCHALSLECRRWR